MVTAFRADRSPAGKEDLPENRGLYGLGIFRQRGGCLFMRYCFSLQLKHIRTVRNQL